VAETTFTANPTGLVGIEFVGTTLFAANYADGTFGRLLRSGPTAFTYTPMPWKGTPPLGSLSALAWDKQADSLYLTTSASLLYTITVEPDGARAQLSANLMAAGYPSGGLADGMGWVAPEQPTGITPPDTDVPTLQLGEPTPNPAREGVWFDVTPIRTMPVDIGIYDSSGRRMRAWMLPALSPGRSRFMWDFRDARGARAPAGVYFIRVRSGSMTLSRQFTHVE
jgi:hypothetical protein